jgi:hypothetical protein
MTLRKNLAPDNVFAVAQTLIFSTFYVHIVESKVLISQVPSKWAFSPSHDFVEDDMKFFLLAP